MSREEGKHRDELFRVTPILKELGYTPDENMCGDAPDILIPSVEKRNIGIEVVSYSTGQNEKAQNALRKVLDEYAGILDRKSDKRFEIGIGLLRQGLPNFTKEKHKIFKELDSLIFYPDKPMDRRFISYVVLQENPGAPRSFISCDEVVEFGLVDEQLLFKCINQKDHKLKMYKQKEKNRTIKEYYLAIYFPIKEGADFQEYTLPNDFKTEYNRIYLVDYFYLKRIK